MPQDNPEAYLDPSFYEALFSQPIVDNGSGRQTAYPEDMLAAGTVGRSLGGLGHSLDSEVLDAARGGDRRAQGEFQLRRFFQTLGPGGGEKGRLPVHSKANKGTSREEALSLLGFGDLA
jgi:hypothetical protein